MVAPPPEKKVWNLREHFTSHSTHRGVCRAMRGRPQHEQRKGDRRSSSVTPGCWQGVSEGARMPPRINDRVVGATEARQRKGDRQLSKAAAGCHLGQ